MMHSLHMNDVKLEDGNHAIERTWERLGLHSNHAQKPPRIFGIYPFYPTSLMCP